MRRIASSPSAPPNSASAGSQSRTIGSSSGSSSPTYGGFDTTSARRAAELRRQRVEPIAVAKSNVGCRAGRCPAALARATSRASHERSVIHTVTPSIGNSAASDRPMAPLPVPRSAQTIGGGSDRASSSATLDHRLGLRSWDQHPPIDHQIEMAEPPPAEHVLQRLTACVPSASMASRWATPRSRRRSIEDVQELVTIEAQTRPRTSIAPEGDRSRAAVSFHSARQLTCRHSSPASWRARSSAVRASTTSSRSPASTSCSR